MRLTADLINSSLCYLNPLKERELDLRGHKIPAIENLGAAGPQDALDLTDNDITHLGNFPLSPRLTTLLLARNRIQTIATNIAQSVPNLANVVLLANNVNELADLTEGLRRCKNLTHLVCLENPVRRKEHYRAWVIWRIPSIRFFDYQKVKDVERKAASKLFGTEETPTALASKILGIKSRTFDSGPATNGVSGEKGVRLKLTDKEKKRVEMMIRKASSLQEISILEKALNEGRIPKGMLDDEDMED